MMPIIEKVWTTTAGLQAAVLIVTYKIEEGGPTYRSHRCGYVAVPSGHRLHGKRYDDDVFCDVDVHGGLTFSDTSGDCPIESIDSSDWLLGFDCAHSGDGMIEKLSQYAPPYEARSLEYCVEQCEHLAQQLAALQPSTPLEYYPFGSRFINVSSRKKFILAPVLGADEYGLLNLDTGLWELVVEYPHPRSCRVPIRHFHEALGSTYTLIPKECMS